MSRFQMDEASMADAASSYNRVSSGMSDARDTSSSSFTGMKNAGFFSKGFSEINKQIGSLGKSIGNVGSTISSQASDVFQMDRTYADKAAEIEIPLDFVGNNSMAINEYNQSILEKLDGESVNEGDENTEKVDEVKDSMIGAEQGLWDQTTDDTNKQKYDEEVSIKEEEKLWNQNNANGMAEVRRDDSSTVSTEELANVNKAGGDVEQNIDSTTSLTGSILGNIAKGGGDTKAQLNDATSISLEQLASLNNAGGKDKQTANTQYQGVNATELKSLNGDAVNVEQAIANDIKKNESSSSTVNKKDQLGDALGVLGAAGAKKSQDMQSAIGDAIGDSFKEV